MAFSSSTFCGLNSPLSPANRELSSKLFYSPKPRISSVRRCSFKTLATYDSIPKELRAENLSPELMENYKNIPSHLFDLIRSQRDMFMADEDQQERENRENSLRTDGPFTTRASWNGRIFKLKRPDKNKSPPDVPSLFLHHRIIVLALPITPAVSHLLALQFLHLDRKDPELPITLYINSSGVRNYQGEVIADDSEAYALADLMMCVKPDVYTLNLGEAQGQAAMLLSLGKKGHRAVLQTNAFTTLHLPRAPQFNGQVSDVWKQANELERATSTYLKLLSQGTGKTPEELEKDIRYGKTFTSQEAIDYGLADTIMYNVGPSSPGISGGSSTADFAERRGRDKQSEEAVRI